MRILSRTILIGTVFFSSLIAAKISDYSIQIPPDSSRIYAFTNRIDAHWSGETNDYHTSAFHGLTYRKQAIFEDFLISLDGEFLDRNQATATVHPTHLTRKYAKREILERVFISEDQHSFIFELISKSPQAITLYPAFPDVDVKLESIDGMAQMVLPQFRTASGLSVKFFISANSPGEWERRDESVIENYPGPTSAIALLQWEGTIRDTLRFVMSFACDRQTHERQTTQWRKGLKRRQQLAQSMATEPVTDNPRINKALLWARLNMDALIMDQSGKGIYAGLPWFDDYWGRDTFISFPGATLVNGNYESAKEIIRSFAEYQITDSTDINYGRIPNRVTPGEKIYNTTDGTPWFIWMIHEYLRYSGDMAFAREMYPVVKRSIEGALENYVTEDGFLEHEDAETWMDAVGPNGPWSPRGSRAVEIQVLWYKQLQSGMTLARLLGKEADLQRWEDFRDQLRSKFNDLYWDNSRQSLYDHLNADGNPDTSRRPNQMFAVSLSDDLVPPEKQGKVVQSVANSAVYPWGVASLAQTNSNFHPYHMMPQFYPKDAAYHNGIIWTWLSGPVVSGLVKFGAIESGYTLTDGLTNKILNRGMAGSIAEVTDALPRSYLTDHPDPNQPVDLSGTFSQAWSLAEYLRNWHQDYFGIHPNAFAGRLTLEPQLPEDVVKVRTSVSVGQSEVRIRYIAEADSFRFLLRNSGKPIDIQLKVRKDDTEFTLSQPFRLAKTEEPVEVSFSYEAQKYVLNGLPLKTRKEKSAYPKSAVEPLRFVTPELRDDLPALQGPDYPLLKGKDATANNIDARTILDVSDPIGDDLGPEQKYQYPADPNFEDGIFDITNFQVLYDEEYVYFDMKFDNLVQPGWHPEYGFQLTYVAIGIHTGENAGTTTFGQNAVYELPPGVEPMQFVLYIGGGYRLVNADGEIIVEYRPAETGFPMADLLEKRIHIAVPKKHIPQPKKWWKYTILTGGQDDHGGAGLGEFRGVQQNAGPWHGGGKTDSGGPNWYDILTVGY
ncbi:MAG: hypothetical protein MAGBODY4_01280 [Candidatus Marinimicrobia bacterium]|nr:hypothetical protein [Candidatus Neomarinimicrobiota bacterium]